MTGATRPGHYGGAAHVVWPALLVLMVAALLIWWEKSWSASDAAWSDAVLVEGVLDAFRARGSDPLADL